MTITAPETAGQQARNGVTFTDRQVEVIRAIAAGRSPEDTARMLGITERTYKAHADYIRGKLAQAGVHTTSRRELPRVYAELTGLNPWLGEQAA